MSSGSDKRPAKVFKWAKLQFQNSKVSKLKRGRVGGLEQNQVFRLHLQLLSSWRLGAVDQWHLGADWWSTGRGRTTANCRPVTNRDRA
uniref:Uncharacterized protein n=1 Tax=Citrus limon TaxID=2708 RepID=A0A1S8AE42_CITLI